MSTGIEMYKAFLFLLCLFVVLAYNLANAFHSTTGYISLLPSSMLSSQTIQKKRRRRKKSSGQTSNPYVATTFLLPSQVIKTGLPATTLQQAPSQDETTIFPSITAVGGDTTSTVTSLNNMSANTTEELPAFSNLAIADTSNHRSSKNNRKRRAAVKKKNAAVAAALATTVVPTQSPVKNISDSFPSTGNLPDICWRAVLMDHLRSHPRFQPLALPEEIAQLDTLEDVRQFRQESWQWDALHQGRCTTSQAVAALGFLEPTAAEALGVPPSWRRGGRGAYQRLLQTPLRTLEEMQRQLLAYDATKQWQRKEHVWTDSSEHAMHVAEYVYVESLEDKQLRRERVRKLSQQGDQLERSVRFLWGNTQEATALLTALNYFSKEHPGVYLREVGMCGAGLQFNQTTNESFSSLLIGATPDGVIVYPDGRIEALEVKNHSPFYSNINRKRKGGKIKRFSIGDRPLNDSHGVFAQYVPQLQLEMLCLGPECRSAVMVRQTATQGALLLRMQRNDTWIEEMLFWLNKFQHDYVEKRQPPRTDFFWCSVNKEEQSRYRRFINSTLEVRNSVKVVAGISADDIQRQKQPAPLFLD
jgi:hypothetical protein